MLEPGDVKEDDEFIVDTENSEGISISELNTLLFHYDETLHKDLLQKAINNPLISDGDKEYFKKNGL